MRLRLFSALCLGVVILAGCSSSPLSSSPKERIRVTSVNKNRFEVFQRFRTLQLGMEKSLGKPVDILSDYDIQSVQIHLTDQKIDDYYHLLYLNPVQYCSVADLADLTPLAVRVNERGATTETGLIVVPAKSKIENVTDIEGKRFAFGPYRSPYMFYNVLELFDSKQLPVSLIKGQIMCQDSLGVAQKILFGQADAGVITKTWWETTQDRTLDLSKLLKDDLKVIAQTQPLPEEMWFATKSLSAEDGAAVKTYLTEEVNDDPGALEPFGADGFTPVQPDMVEDLCRRIKEIKNIPPQPFELEMPWSILR